MKNLFKIILVLGLLSSTSCNKEEVTPTPIPKSQQDDLQGIWFGELVFYQDGVVISSDPNAAGTNVIEVTGAQMTHTQVTTFSINGNYMYHNLVVNGQLFQVWEIYELTPTSFKWVPQGNPTLNDTGDCFQYEYHR